MNSEQKPEDLQSLVKEQVRLTKWLIRIVAVQAIFVIPFMCAFLWMVVVPFLIAPNYYGPNGP